MEKIFLLNRIKRQEKSSLCYKVYEEGKQMGWPGLGKEISEICEKVGIPDLNEVDMPMVEVKAAVKKHHWKYVREQLENSKKLKDILTEDFSRPQEYFNEKSIENGRMAFQIRSQMVKEIPANFKNKYKEEDRLCKFCQEEKTLSQSHCVVCPAWEHQREGLELDKIEDLVIFYREILSEMEKEKKKKKKGPQG